MDYRKKGIFYLLIALLVSSLLTGCAPKNAPADGLDGAAWSLTDAKREYPTQWPENAFTEKVTEPQSGTIDYVLDSSDSGRYALFLKDISAKEGERYIQALKDMGYTEVRSASNQVSIGTLLDRADASLSVSCAEGVLGVLITLKEGGH